MQTTLTPEIYGPLLEKVASANRALARRYPGDRPNRQPVHTVYGGAQLFKADTAVKMGSQALRALAEYAPNFSVLAGVLEFPDWQSLPRNGSSIKALDRELATDPETVKQRHPAAWLAGTVYAHIVDKLEREPVEDFRIDFEDGYGNRPDAEEDETAVYTANQVAEGRAGGLLPPFIGIRIKPFTEELKHRSVRTLDLFLTALLRATEGRLPRRFVVTLPKVTHPHQVAALVSFFQVFEKQFGLDAGRLHLEIMVETTQAIFDPKGYTALPAMVDAAQGRCVGAHFGTYDYTASCDITARYQVMDHPVCDFARHVMKASLAGTGIWLSDGATNVMPIGPHRPGEKPLTQAQRRENAEVVHRAWKLGYDHIQHSLKHGFYQGWDLHPTQLPIRYAACYNFFLQGLPAASKRLGNFIEQAARATLVGDVFDDAATGQGLLNYFLRALNCGAIDEAEVRATGLTLEEVRGRSFLKILQNRRTRASN